MNKLQKRASLDMTQGSAFSLILRFALPLLAGNALQQLYNMVDSIVVGQFVGSTALAAVGISFPVIFMLASLFMGLGMGAMVMVSQYYGGEEWDNLHRTVDTVYTALMVGTVPLTVLGIIFTNPLLDLLKVPADARSEAYVYLVIVMAGLIGSLGYNLNAGLLQGVGDSKTPLLFLTIACLLNIALDLFLVLVIPLGVAGVAIATIAAQFFSWVFGIIYINKKYPELKIHPFNFKFDKHIFFQVTRLGIPVGIQQALFSIAVMLMMRLVNQYGTDYAAGFNAANKLDAFAFLPIQSVTNAVTAYTGQNIGAGKLARVKHGTVASLQLCVGFALLGLLVIPLGPSLMRLFSDNPAVIDAGTAFLYRILPFYTLLAVSFTVNSVIRGAGDSMLPMISAIVALWLARLPAAYLLVRFAGRDQMHFSYAVGWAMGLAISVPYYFSGRWKRKAITRAGASAGREETAESPER